MSGFRIEVEAAHDIADLHTQAARGISDLASSQPDDLDGGVGSSSILSILAYVGLDAGRIAELNTDISERVRDSVDLVTGYDADAADGFRAISQDMP